SRTGALRPCGRPTDASRGPRGALCGGCRARAMARGHSGAPVRRAAEAIAPSPRDPRDPLASPGAGHDTWSRAGPAQPPMPTERLRVVARGEIRHLALGAAEIRLGSAADNDLVIAIPGVSRHHAVLRPSVDGWRLEDLRSKNGLIVAGVREPCVLLT